MAKACEAGVDVEVQQAESVPEMLREIVGSIDKAMDLAQIQVVDLEPDDVPWPEKNAVNSYSILSGASLASKRALVEEASATNELNRVMGLMVGMGLGDAIGAPLEFLPVQEVPGEANFDLQSMGYHGEKNKFKLQRGQWTDDAAMGLCMADSLILRHGFDGSDMRKRFWCWWYRGYNNAFLKDSSRSDSVGLGGNIAKSLHDCRKHVFAGQPVPPAYGSESQDAGNGSLMRLAPIAAFFHSTRDRTLHDVARLSSYTTHPGTHAAEACAFFAHLLRQALALPAGDVDVKAFLEAACENYWEAAGLEEKAGEVYDQIRQLVRSSPTNERESCWNWRSERLAIERTLQARGRHYNGYPVTPGYFGSFCMDGIALALWAVYHSRSFDDAVVRCVNLLGDADSHGSIAGQLAGAIYGYGGVGSKLLGWLTRWDDHGFAVRGLLLFSLGASWPEPEMGRIGHESEECGDPSSR